jgi:hypothetical protein
MTKTASAPWSSATAMQQRQRAATIRAARSRSECSATAVRDSILLAQTEPRGHERDGLAAYVRAAHCAGPSYWIIRSRMKRG